MKKQLGYSLVPAHIRKTKPEARPRIGASIDHIRHLIELDTKYYSDTNSDLKSFNDDELVEHYFKFGYFEGRKTSPLSVRENFISHFQDKKALEIGPFCKPALRGDQVKYIDILNTEQLIERARKNNLDSKNVPNIDYIAEEGTLRTVDDQFEIVFSSHNLEHQTDLISHLNEVSELLVEGGQYALIVPNARYCFDAKLSLSNIGDIFNAYEENRKSHTIGSLIEHRALTTTNETMIHWEDQTSYNKFYAPIDVNRVKAALKEYEDSKDTGFDVHAWQFDPLSLSDIINTLIELGYVNYSSVKCNGPVLGRNEFTLTIQK